MEKKKRNIDYVGKEVPTETKLKFNDAIYRGEKTDKCDGIYRGEETLKMNADGTIAKEVPEVTDEELKEKHDEMTDEQRDTICYKSKLLNRYFDKYSDLIAAEHEFKHKNELELKEKEERKLAAKKVEDAYRGLIEAKKKAVEIIDEAEKKYLAERDEFIEKYRSYHLTYSNINGKENISISDLVNKVFDRPKLPFFDDFFDRW